MRVALYLRRSTNEELQADSLATQEELLRAFATKHGYPVVEVFSDSASGRSAKRGAFQRLVDAVANKPTFDAILVRDVTRWGRFENVDESAYWEFYCLTFGVHVVYVEENFRSDTSPYATLLKVLKRVQAAEFSKDKSRMVQYAKARVVRGGFYAGGSAPYGMQREVVRPDGTLVQKLAPGEHKAIGNYRMKLAPGRHEEIATVRRIFALFLAGAMRKHIARQLTAEGIPSPTGGTWKYCAVHKILRNPSYAGVAHLRCAPSENFPNGERILTPASWEGIVCVEDWQKANDLLDKSLWRRTPPGLAEQLRQAFESFGCIDKRMRSTVDLPMWETYLRRFDDGYRDALALAYKDLIAKTREQITRQLREHVSFRCQGEQLIVEGLLRVGFKASFPRMLRGGLYWEYGFTGDEEADVTIGLGFSPPPQVALLETFLFHNARFRQRKRTIHPNLSGRSIYGTFRRTVPEIAISLKRHVFKDARRARELFLDAARKHPILDLPRFADSLGWRRSVAYAMYRALKRDGHTLPPLKHAKNKQVDVTCGDCGAVRRMTIREALLHKTTFCGKCWQKHRGGWSDVRCPRCGKVRRYWQSDLRRLSNGTETPCSACVGDKWHAAAQRTRIRNNERRHAGVRAIALRIQAVLARDHKDVRIRQRKHQLSPTISWRVPHSMKRRQLRVTCSQRAALLLAGLEEHSLDRIATLLTDRRRWRRLTPFAWRVNFDRAIDREVGGRTDIAPSRGTLHREVNASGARGAVRRTRS